MMAKTARLGRDTFEIRRWTNGVRLSVEVLSSGDRVTLFLLATLSLVSKWWIVEAVHKTLRPDIDLQLVMPFLEEV